VRGIDVHYPGFLTMLRLRPRLQSILLNVYDALHYNVFSMRRNDFARNLAAGTYDLIVLDILHGGPNYGYGIRKRIFARSKGTLNWLDGTTYPVLRHLEKQGLITSRWYGPKDGRQRCYYRLTPLGQRIWQQQRRQWTVFTRAINALLVP
jgi:PadR family transcriptional regulator, regulatory protein PadR